MSSFTSFMDWGGALLWVNRRERPMYPEGLRMCHVEMQQEGPVEYSIPDAKWWHPEQVQGVAGKKIYETILRKEDIASFAGWLDLLYIERRGPGFFEKHFAGKSVVGWKSVALAGSGLVVPVTSLHVQAPDDRKIIHEWRNLRRVFDRSFVGLQYPLDSTKH